MVLFKTTEDYLNTKIFPNMRKQAGLNYVQSIESFQRETDV